MTATNTLPKEKEELVNFIPETDFNVFKAKLICGDPFFDCCSIHYEQQFIHSTIFNNNVLVKHTENTILLERHEQVKKKGFFVSVIIECPKNALTEDYKTIKKDHINFFNRFVS